MLPEATRLRIIEAIYGEPELNGAQIGYYGDEACSVLSPGYTPSSNYNRVMVIVEETDGAPSGAISPPDLLSPDPTTVAEVPAFISNQSRVQSELVGAGLSCGFAVVAGIGMVAGAAAEIPSAGTSTALVIVSYIGFASSIAQCINGVARASEALANPTGNSLQQWDESKLYSVSMLIVDAVGVVTAIAALPSATRNLIAVIQRRGGLASAEALARMTRVERQAAIRAAVQQAARTPEGQQELLQALRAAGLSERQAAQAMQHGAATGRRVQIVARAISEVTAARLNAHLLAAVGGGLSPLVSATPSRLTGSASGSVNALIVHVLNMAESQPAEQRQTSQVSGSASGT